MGLDAEVIAVGPFSQAILPAMEYGPDFYVGVSDGTTVITNLFIAGTSEASRNLALAFGVGAMDLGRHVLDADSANIEKLTEVFGGDNTAQFQLLANHGFTFYFLPNA